MRIAPFHIAQLAAIAFLGACGDDDGGGATGTDPVESIADHVQLGVSQGEPSFSFPKESAGPVTSTFSNIARNTLGQTVSFDLTVTYSSSGNRYDIKVSSIVRNSVGNTTSFTASITATIDGRTLSGTLSFP